MKKLFFLLIILASISLIDAFGPNFVTYPTVSQDFVLNKILVDNIRERFSS